MFAEQGAIFARHRLVALAGGVLEADAVQDGDPAVLIADDASLLQRAGGDADGGAAHAQHHGDQVLRKRQLRDAAAIVRGQQPAGETLAEFMVCVAGGGLRHLDVEDVRVAQQQIAQVRRLRDDLLQRGRGDAIGARPPVWHMVSL